MWETDSFPLITKKKQVVQLSDIVLQIKVIRDENEFDNNKGAENMFFFFKETLQLLMTIEQEDFSHPLKKQIRNYSKK